MFMKLIIFLFFAVSAELVPKTIWKSTVPLPIKVDVHGVQNLNNSDNMIIYGITSGEEGFYYRRNTSEKYSIINGTVPYYRKDNAMVLQCVNGRGEFEWGVTLFGASYYNFWYAPTNNLWTVLDDGVILTGYFFRSLDFRDKFGRATLVKKKTSSFYEQFVVKISLDGEFLWGTSLNGSLSLKLNPALFREDDSLSITSFGIPSQTFQAFNFRLNASTGQQLSVTDTFWLPIFSFVPNITRIMPVQHGPCNTFSIFQIVLASGVMENLIVPHNFSWLLVLEKTCNVAVISPMEGDARYLSIMAGFLHPNDKNSCSFERFDTDDPNNSKQVDVPIPSKAPIRISYLMLNLNGTFQSPVLSFQGSDNPFVKSFSCTQNECSLVTFMFANSGRFVTSKGDALHEPFKSSSLVQLTLKHDKIDDPEMTKYWSRKDGGNCTSGWLLNSFQVDNNWICIEKDYVFQMEMVEIETGHKGGFSKLLLLASIAGGIFLASGLIFVGYIVVKRRINSKNRVQLQSVVNDREPLVTNSDSA